MKAILPTCLALQLCLVSCSPATQRQASSNEARTIKAVRADTAPVLDGKLDDACWQKAKPIGDFLILSSEQPATVDSFGYVCYDDTNLYIGTKYMTANGSKPKGINRTHDSYLFGDDLLEFMLDPGRTQSEYYQIAVNAYGSTYDSARRGAGTQNDKSWNGEWKSIAFIGDDYWSLELAIPFYNLGITPDVGSTWGINFCRQMQEPFHELSASAIRGVFNNAKNFVVLEDLDVDFSKYLLTVGPADVRLAKATDSPKAAFSVPVTNMTGKARNVKIESFTDQEVTASQTVQLGVGKTATLDPESLDLEPISSQQSDTYVVQTAAKTQKIVVSDADDGTILAVSLIRRPWICEAIWIETRDPWQHQTPPTKTAAVSVTVHTRLDSQLRSNGKLLVELLNRDSGEVVASQQLAQVDDRNELTFSTEKLAWGAYDVRASFQETGGPSVIARSVATILPGGEHRIKVLNNMVSELMNAKERKLLGSGEISFMNPRQGWVYFSIAGEGSVTLDSDPKPVVAARGEDSPVEAFRHLPAGRHNLRAEGDLEQVIVRSVPQLIYSANPTKFEPDVMAEALDNANTFLGGGTETDFMREWVGTGKRWITFASAPSHQIVGGHRRDEAYVSADDYFKQLSAHAGYANPLISGVMVDQISAASPLQKAAMVTAVSRLNAIDKYADKEFSPWYEGSAFGSDAARALLRFVVDSRVTFSGYSYLAERTTEAEARAMIDGVVRGAVNNNQEYPGALKRNVITLGYMSHAPLGISQDSDPNADFKVLMHMQVEAFATDPAVFGVYGMLWYYSPYVNEEYLRWAGRMFRHFGIEGNTAPLTTDPYILAHIKNGDFVQGTEDWTIHEAEPGSVTVSQMAGYGMIQNRYPAGPKGNTFLLMKRSEKGPNSFSQEITGLEAGRLYSMRMITADHGNITAQKSVKQQDVVSIQLEGVDIEERAGKDSQETYDSRTYRGQFTKSEPAWLNFHWYIFRATGTSARLQVSDWACAEGPGGAIGQELMVNFVEVQPYLE